MSFSLKNDYICWQGDRMRVSEWKFVHRYELFLVLFIYALDCHNKKKTEDENQAQALSVAAY